MVPEIINLYSTCYQNIRWRQLLCKGFMQHSSIRIMKTFHIVVAFEVLFNFLMSPMTENSCITKKKMCTKLAKITSLAVSWYFVVSNCVLNWHFFRDVDSQFSQLSQARTPHGRTVNIRLHHSMRRSNRPIWKHPI